RRGEGGTPLLPRTPFCASQKLVLSPLEISPSIRIRTWSRVTCLPPTHRLAHWDRSLRRLPSYGKKEYSSTLFFLLDARKKCRFCDGEVLWSARYGRGSRFLVENKYFMEGKKIDV
ncbi:unnamed protein product, partial [Ixodes pacificus]